MKLKLLPRPGSRTHGLSAVRFGLAAIPAVLELHGFSAIRFPFLSVHIGYLEAAELFSRTGLLESKTPLYSPWPGLFSLHSGPIPWWSSVIEKAVSLVIRALGMGSLRHSGTHSLPGQMVGVEAMPAGIARGG